MIMIGSKRALAVFVVVIFLRRCG